jgi:uncharacterized membrane protein YbhN (UPF0104 family)
MDNDSAIAGVEALEPLPGGIDTRRLLVRIAQIAVVVAVVVALVSALPGLGDVRGRFSGARPGWLALSLVAQIGSVLAFVAVFRGTFCRLLPWKLSYEIAMTEQAANVLLPTGGAGGLALGAWALRRGGMSADRVARRTVAFFLVTSAVNFGVAILAGFVLATGALGDVDAIALALVPAILATVTVIGVLALPRVLPKAPGELPEGRIRRALHVSSRAVSDGIGDSVGLVRSGNGHVIAGSLGYMILDMLALAAAFKAFGGGAPEVGAFALAYTVGQLGGLVPLPGGIGGTDGGLVAVFALYGTSAGAAAAAVLAYRVFQLGLPAVLGSIAFRRLPATLARADDQAAGCEPEPEPRLASAA